MTLHSACSIFEEVGVLQHRIEEDVARVHVLAGDHPEDGDVLRTVRQRQFYLHAVVVGIGEDAVFRKFVQAECKVKLALTLLRRRQIYDPFFSAACFPFIVSIIRKSVGLHKGKPAD